MPTLIEIAELLGCPAPAGEPLEVTGVAAITEAAPGELSYIASDAFLRDLGQCQASALIVQQNVKLPPTWTRPALWVADAELAVAKVLGRFAPPVPRPPAGIDSMARVDATAVLGENVAIAPFVFIGRRVHIGAASVIHPGVYIGDDTTLGDHCEIFPNVTIRERVTIGNRVIIHAGSVLGTDGFGYRWDGQKQEKIPQIGNVVIEDDVEIGSCTCIDRAKFSTTRVGRGAKIDNLVQIGHNVQIGPHCILAGQTGVAGTAKVGAGAVLGGQTSVRDHVTIGEGSMIAGTSGVADDIPPRSIYSGTPAIPHRQTLREQRALRRLPEMQVKIQEMKAEIEALKNKPL